MNKPVLYFAPWCPDTEPFVAKLQALNVTYHACDIVNERANFKAFLRLRDTHPAFDNAKANGYIGIPALVLEGEKVVLDIEELTAIFG
ncbi:hypothetical protein [Necropsobacter massiliensis]|uniref:hypothetical protein n=1 Tax=Necropsobacter massiliensis TaxID=1400001 RepID=UPI000595FF00|nr:hypothetical protein [Necropsobacter massiliensis]